MKTKHTILTMAGAFMLLLNPFILSAQQWSAVRYDQHNIFNKVSAPTANTVFVTGVYPSSSQQFILRTNDAGVTWDSTCFDTMNDAYELTKLYFFDANTGFIGGTKNSHQVLLKTTDNGNTWIEITPNASSTEAIRSVHFIDMQNGFATDGGFLYQTMDGGYSWVPTTLTFNMRDLYFFNMNHGLACGDTSGAGLFMRTFDGGQTWDTLLSAQTPPSWLTGSFAKLDVVNSNVIFTALDNWSWLYRSLDGGNSWQIIDVDSIDIIRDFDFADANNGHILGEIGWAQEDRILITADAGQNTTMEYTTGWNFYGGGVILNAFSFVDQTGYTAGSNGLVKKYYPIAAGISEEENSQTASVYPNPFSTSTTLHIANWNGLKTKNAELKIHNTFGQEVLHTEIHSQDFELGRENLTRGIYLYSITNGNEILATGKLVVTD